MTVSSVVDAADPLAPVRATLLAMERRPDAPRIDGLAPGLTVADRTGWVTASSLVAGSTVDDFLDTAQRRWNAPRHTALALAWKAYTYWLTLPAVVGFAGSRRVPLLRPDNVLVRFSPHEPFLVLGLTSPTVAVLPTDPLALESRTIRRARRVKIVPDDAALLAEFRHSIMDRHLTPLLAQLRQRARLGRHTLWGSLASGIAYGLSRSADVTPGSTLATAEQMLGALGLDHLVDLAGRPDGALEIHRRTCCLAFTLPQPTVCGGCVLR